MIDIGEILDLELTKIKHFPHNQGSEKFGIQRKRTPLKESPHFTGEHVCLLLYIRVLVHSSIHSFTITGAHRKIKIQRVY